MQRSGPECCTHQRKAWWFNTRFWWINTRFWWINTQGLVDQHQVLVDQHQVLVDRHPGFGGSTPGFVDTRVACRRSCPAQCPPELTSDSSTPWAEGPAESGSQVSHAFMSLRRSFEQRAGFLRVAIVSKTLNLLGNYGGLPAAAVIPARQQPAARYI